MARLILTFPAMDDCDAADLVGILARVLPDDERAREMFGNRAAGMLDITVERDMADDSQHDVTVNAERAYLEHDNWPEVAAAFTRSRVHQDSGRINNWGAE